MRQFPHLWLTTVISWRNSLFCGGLPLLLVVKERDRGIYSTVNQSNVGLGTWLNHEYHDVQTNWINNHDNTSTGRSFNVFRPGVHSSPSVVQSAVQLSEGLSVSINWNVQHDTTKQISINISYLGSIRFD